MKKIIITLLLMITTNCAKYKAVTINSVIEERVYNFYDVASGIYSGSLSVIIDYDNKVTVTQVTKFISMNSSQNFGVHPTVNMSKLTLLKDKKVLTYATDLTYSSSNDLEKDGTSSNLSNGSHYTVYKLEVDNDNKLLFTIVIYDGASNSNGSIDKIVITRTFKEVEQ